MFQQNPLMVELRPNVAFGIVETMRFSTRVVICPRVGDRNVATMLVVTLFSLAKMGLRLQTYIDIRFA